MAETYPLERIPKDVAGIAGRLLDNAFEAWYVGAAVRDVLLEQLKDGPKADLSDAIIDIATSATPEQVQGLFKRTVPVGIEHGTVAVLDSANRPHEITTFRKDVTTDGRHAVVAFGVSLEEDLARRDFTMNAIAVHPKSGEIRDPFEGTRDLKAGLVRAVGDPATRFREDYLRVLRALRFAATLGFQIEPATWAAVRAAAKDLGHLSRERVRDEWLRTLAGAAPSVALRLWREAGVLTEVWPELATLSVELDGRLDALPRDAVLVTAGALALASDARRTTHEAPKAAEAAAKRLRFSNKDIERVKGVVEAQIDLPEPEPAAVRRWMAKHRAVAHDAAEVAGDPLHKQVDVQLKARVPLSIGELAVKGEDLKAAGIAAGPRMGEVLRALLDAVLEDPALNTREALLAKAKALA